MEPMNFAMVVVLRYLGGKEKSGGDLKDVSCVEIEIDAIVMKWKRKPNSNGRIW